MTDKIDGREVEQTIKLADGYGFGNSPEIVLLKQLYAFAKPLMEAAGESRIVGVAVECEVCTGQGWYWWNSNEGPEQQQCRACNATGHRIIPLHGQKTG